jgi:predicted double-glycine peptidase
MKGAGPGVGGGLPYLTENATANMVNQELSHSCQAACARQLLLDAGVDVAEQVLRNRIGYLDGFGTTAGDTAKVLSDLHPRVRYNGGAVDPEGIAVLSRRTPWIATLRTNRGSKHAVIVDKLEGEVVHLRDPWGISGPGSGTGTMATMRIKDFLEHWKWAIHNVVIPVHHV